MIVDGDELNAHISIEDNFHFFVCVLVCDHEYIHRRLAGFSKFKRRILVWGCLMITFFDVDLRDLSEDVLRHAASGIATLPKLVVEGWPPIYVAMVNSCLIHHFCKSWKSSLTMPRGDDASRRESAAKSANRSMKYSDSTTI